MRAGTSIPAFSLGGISQMQSPAGFTFMTSDVDHDAGAPSALAALEGELVERDRLGVGAELHLRRIEHTSRDLCHQLEGPAPMHVDPDAGVDLPVAVLPED